MSKNKLPQLLLLVLSVSLLSSCKRSKQVEIPPTPTPKMVEIELDQRPYVSLVPRDDGHELKLTVNDIPDIVTQVEYEFIYTAADEGLIIEKGLAGTLEISNSQASQDLLLGTASCTNGCKYKYDTGVTGGSLILTFTTSQNQIAMYETNFVLTTTADIKQDGLNLDDLSIVATPKTNAYFIILKNYTQDYSVFSNGPGSATIESITDGFTKEDMTKITGDYSYQHVSPTGI